MRRGIARAALAGVWLLGLAAGGCGNDRVDRGLAPSQEPATPESSKDLGESASQRQQQTEGAMQKESDAAFDAQEGGSKPAAP